MPFRERFDYAEPFEGINRWPQSAFLLMGLLLAGRFESCGAGATVVVLSGTVRPLGRPGCPCFVAQSGYRTGVSGARGPACEVVRRCALSTTRARTERERLSALTFDVECLTSRTATRGVRHSVTLHPDGYLDTPHDLAAEKVAAAFGGYCSCLQLAEAAPDLLAEAVGLLTRRTRPPLTRRPNGRWYLPRASTCRCPPSYRTPAAAAAHARSSRHLAARHSSRERAVRTILENLERTLPAAPADHELAARIREASGLATLWQAGIHPDDVGTWLDLANAVNEPLPVTFFLGALYGALDPTFLTQALPGRPDANTAAWLAWLPPDLQHGPDCHLLLSAGLPRDDVMTLLTAMPSPALTQMADAVGLPVATVGRTLAVWARAGCMLQGEHVRLLASHGLLTHHPSSTTLDALHTATGATPHAPSRTELGVMAALAGGRVPVLSALHRGIGSAAELATWLEAQ